MPSVRFSNIIQSEDTTYVDESIPKLPSKLMKPISYTSKKKSRCARSKKRKQKRKLAQSSDGEGTFRDYGKLSLRQSALLDSLEKHLPNDWIESSRSSQHSNHLNGIESANDLNQSSSRGLTNTDNFSNHQLHIQDENERKLLIAKMVRELMEDEGVVTSSRSHHEKKPFIKSHQNRSDPFYWRDEKVCKLNKKIEEATWKCTKAHERAQQRQRELMRKREKAASIRDKFLKQQKRNLVKRVQAAEPSVLTALQEYVESSVNTPTAEHDDGDNNVFSQRHAKKPISSGLPVNGGVSTSGFRKYKNGSSKVISSRRHRNSKRVPLPKQFPVESFVPNHSRQEEQNSVPSLFKEFNLHDGGSVSSNSSRRSRSLLTSSSSSRSSLQPSSIFQRVLQPGRTHSAPHVPLPKPPSSASAAVRPRVSRSNQDRGDALLVPQRISQVNRGELRSGGSMQSFQSSTASHLRSRLYSHINQAKKPSTSHGISSTRRNRNHRTIVSSDYTGLSWRKRRNLFEAEDSALKKSAREELASLDSFTERLKQQQGDSAL